jgi:hypothetical protein
MNLRRKNIFLSGISLLILITGIFLSKQSERFVRFLYSLLNLSLDVHFRSIGFYYAGTWLIVISLILLLYLLKINGYLKPERFIISSAALVIIHYFFHLSAIAINYPMYDDQGVILDFLLKFQKADSFGEKAGLIFTPYNEYILAIPKLIVLAWFKIFGEINFRHLVLFNGFLLVLIYAVFFSEHIKKWSPWVLFFTLLIFQFQFYDDAFWPTSGLCYYNTFLFTSGCIYFLFKKDYRNNIISAIFALLATLTFGNGWLLIPFAFIFLIINKKNYLLLPWIIALLLAATVFYFQRKNFHPLSQELNLNPFENILFVLVFLGSSLQFFYSPVIPVIGGIFVISTFLYVIFRKKDLTSSFTFIILGFIILSALAASPVRSGLEPYGQSGMQVRYGFFSIMAIALCFSLLAKAHVISKRKMIFISVAACVYNLLTGLFFYPEPVIRKEKIEVVIDDIKHNNFEIRFATLSKEEVDNLFKESIARGIYKP